MATDAERNHFEVIIRGTTDALGGQSQSTYTKLHYVRTPGVGTYSPSSTLTALLAKFKTEWLALSSIKWNMDSIGIRVLNDPTEVEVISVVDEPGAVAGDMVQADVCHLFAKGSSLRGGNYRGKAFIPGVAETNADGNELSAAGKTLADALAAKLLQTVSAGGCTFTPAILSTRKSKLKMKNNPAVVFMTPCTTFIARKRLSSLDSRHSKIQGV